MVPNTRLWLDRFGRLGKRHDRRTTVLLTCETLPPGLLAAPAPENRTDPCSCHRAEATYGTGDALTQTAAFMYLAGLADTRSPTTRVGHSRL